MLAQRLALCGLPATALFFVGCVSPDAPLAAPPFQEAVSQVTPQDPYELVATTIQPVDFQEELSDLPSIPGTPSTSLTLLQLEQTALQQNPRLLKLSQDYQAALAKSQYADKLPDPRFGANVFGNAIETAAGSQRANMTFSQAIPWLSRLNADQQRVIFEAYAIHSELEAERLRVVAQIRTGWYRLYVVDRQIEIAKANQELLESLIQLANARIATGAASQGDVLLGTVELSQLEERLLMYRRQRQGIEVEINRLVARRPDEPISGQHQLDVSLPRQSIQEISLLAQGNQPELEAARLRTQATRWGIEVARLMRRPEFMISASYFPTDDNRPPSTIVDVGQDPWALGAQMSIPIWHQKYDAMENEAKWKHQAAHASVEELSDRYDALVVDLYAEANRAQETANLYQTTILPQARQTLAADQEAYSNGSVDFDRVIRDYRNLLTLELGLHQAKGDLAIAIAKLQQVAGNDLTP
ncbi:TolC family protein [Bremerella alba]|uniref:Outer membrane efflux protein n=1 Tax=Bremerella alba TaxID=980252 RepID=A0A7V9A872_9BACT|nr:TolC family protein [Bremerella alba]MBA2116122.1 hypothetical protein [Bremerella alba]